MLASISEMRHRIRGTLYAVFAVAFLALGNLASGTIDSTLVLKLVKITSLALGALCMIGALIDHQMAVEMRLLVTDAHKEDVKDRLDVTQM